MASAVVIPGGQAAPRNCPGSRSARARWFLVLAATLFLAPLPSRAGKTFIVNTSGDAADPNAGEPGDDGVCDTDLATPGIQCTLRAAIQNHNANRHLDHNLIHVELPGTNPEILLQSALPPILGSVTISGINTGGGGGRLVLDGSLLSDNEPGLQLLGADCVIRSLVIHSFPSHGIYIGGTPPPGGGGHRIESNLIGTDATGSQARGNGGDGIHIEDTPTCIIGGDIANRNVISGNAGYGIRVVGRDPDFTGTDLSGAPGTEISGNAIGLDSTLSIPLPNALGGICIENARDQSIGGEQESKANTISGPATGIRIEGTLAGGIEIIGNFIGREGTGSKFEVGILSRGKLVRIKGNTLTQIAGIGIDAFLDADGIYEIRNNAFNGSMTVGTKLTFGEGRTILVEYNGNLHARNGQAVQFEESVTSTINWNVIGNYAQLGQAGGSIVLRADGEKNFADNRWELNAGAGFRFVGEVGENVRSIVTVDGEIYDRNDLEGVGLNATIRGELTWVLLRTASKSSGKEGILVEAFLAGGGKFDWRGSDLDISANAEAGIRAIAGESVVPFATFHLERSLITGNGDDGIVLFGFDLKRTILANTITGNLAAGIRLSGNSDGIITGNTITQNGTGIILTDQSRASYFDNAIHGNTLLAVDLGGDGPTPNDPGDADTGPNDLQNHPIPSRAYLESGDITVEGSLESTPDTPFRIHVFASSSCHPSGYGQGETYLGYRDVQTDANGAADFSLTLPAPTAETGDFITLLAANPAGAESEYSPCVPVSDVPTDPAFRIARLLDSVESLAAAGLPRSDADSLQSTLSGALALFDADNTGSAIHAMLGFIDQLDPLVAAGRLAPASRDELQSHASILLKALPPGGLTNLSIRAGVGTADQALIVGFVVRGTAGKPVLIRAAGPALAQFQVNGFLTDPTLSLHRGDMSIASNDNWADTAISNIAATAERLGAFPWLAGSADAALLHTVSPVPHTAIVAGLDNATGVALVELYDATEETARSPTQRLVNISTRGFVGTGDSILIAGFVIDGEAPRRCLIRGVGPQLKTFGLEDVLVDPVLELHQPGGLLAANDDWDGANQNPDIIAAMALVGAFPLEPGSTDAALLLDLPPGTYTAHLRGKGGATGLALIEVYEM